jgi:Flp pilus assembly pilin Flp
MNTQVTILLSLINSKILKRYGNERGATLVEYVMLITAVMLLAIAAFKSLAQSIGTAAANGGAAL